MRHIFIIGAKGFTYGGYETFLSKLTEYHQDNRDIQYHIACKANGSGLTDEASLQGVKVISDSEYFYHNAHCFKIKSPELGSAQALFYDIKSLKYCCRYIEENKIDRPIVYILSSRIGPFIKPYIKRIHAKGGLYYLSPDGRESKRSKYIWPIRKYWAISEKYMVKYSDLVICDSINIEKYIQETYHHKTKYITYGADPIPSKLSDDEINFTKWLEKHEVTLGNYYLSVGRFVPENNYEVMIREFIHSNTEKDFVIISNEKAKYYNQLEKKLHFCNDKRIKFVGTVYDQELLKKIRENAFAYIHGHSVGGTNPSLLEALASTKLNLLYDVAFNREVGSDAVLYWDSRPDILCKLINNVESIDEKMINVFGMKAKARISETYNWTSVCSEYEKMWFCE